MRRVGAVSGVPKFRLDMIAPTELRRAVHLLVAVLGALDMVVVDGTRMVYARALGMDASQHRFLEPGISTETLELVRAGCDRHRVIPAADQAIRHRLPGACTPNGGDRESGDNERKLHLVTGEAEISRRGTVEAGND